MWEGEDCEQGVQGKAPHFSKAQARPQTPPALRNRTDQYRTCHVQLFCEKKPEVSPNSTPH